MPSAPAHETAVRCYESNDIRHRVGPLQRQRSRRPRTSDTGVAAVVFWAEVTLIRHPAVRLGIPRDAQVGLRSEALRPVLSDALSTHIGSRMSVPRLSPKTV